MGKWGGDGYLFSAARKIKIMMTFSVLICTYNRPDLIKMSLSALIDKTTEKPDQIVIVNGGDERSDMIVKSFVERSNIQIDLIKTVNKNLATSRNIGLAYCKGDIVAMTDDDAEVSPDWVTQLKRLHADHPEAGAIGGAVIGAESDYSFLSKLSDVATFPSAKSDGYVRTIPGVNVSYKREVLEKLGPQDETLFRGEDVDFNWKVHKLGYYVYYNPNVKVIHYHRPSLSKFLYQHYMYGRAYYRVRKKWKDMYCVYPHRLRTIKDVIRLGYFLFCIFYEPLILVKKFPQWQEKVKAFFVLFLTQLYWKWGMIEQSWRDR